MLNGGAATFLSGTTEPHTRDLDFAGGQAALDAFLQVIANRQHGRRLNNGILDIIRVLCVHRSADLGGRLHCFE